MSDPVFIMLVGLPGSGKSTFAERFIADSVGDVVYISTDSFIEGRAAEAGITYDEAWPNHIKEATDAAWARFRSALRRNASVVWDQTNLSVKKRKSVVAKVPDTYTKQAVVFEIEEGVRRQRLSNRVGKTVPPTVDVSMRDSYVRPTVDEGFDFVLDGVTGTTSECAA